MTTYAVTAIGTDQPGIVALPPRGLRPRTPSSPGSLALARSSGDDRRQ